MYSKKYPVLNRVTPSMLKTFHKYSQTLILLLQRTTNQITPLAFTRIQIESFTAGIYGRIARISIEFLEFLESLELLESLESLE